MWCPSFPLPVSQPSYHLGQENPSNLQFHPFHLSQLLHCDGSLVGDPFNSTFLLSLDWHLCTSQNKVNFKLCLWHYFDYHSDQRPIITTVASNQQNHQCNAGQLTQGTGSSNNQTKAANHPNSTLSHLHCGISWLHHKRGGKSSDWIPLKVPF